MAIRLCTEPGCARKHQARGYCGSHYNKHFPNKQPKALVPCTICGTLVMKDKRDHAKRRPVCSDMCRTFLQTGHWPICMVTERPAPSFTRRELALAKLARAASLPPSSRRWYVGRCKRCGDWFVHNMPHTNWCSKACLGRAARAKRRARKRKVSVEFVSRFDIFERDRWLCRIPNCVFPTRRVSRTKMVPHPRSAVLDHIVPLSKGGKHEAANLQCAHFMCNSLKGDRPANEQLMLIG